jgi:MFS family permease
MPSPLFQRFEERLRSTLKVRGAYKAHPLHHVSFLQGNALILCLTSTVWGFAGNLGWPFISLYVWVITSSATSVGIIQSAKSIGSCIAFIPGGYIADTYGRRKLIGYGSLLAAISNSLVTVSILMQNINLLFLSLFINGLTTIYLPAIDATIADSIPPGHRGIEYAIYQQVTSIPTLVMPFFAGFLIDSWGAGDRAVGMRGVLMFAFLASSLLGIFVALTRLKFLKETLTAEDKEKKIRSNAKRKTAKEIFLDDFKVLRNLGIRKAFPVIGSPSILSFINALVSAFFVIYAVTIIKISVVQFGLLMLISALSRIAIGVPCGKFVDKIGISSSLILGGALMPLTFAGYLFATNFTHLIILSLVDAIRLSIYAPAQSSYAASVIPQEERGRAMALAELFPLLCTIPAPIVGGFLYTGVDPHSIFHIACIFSTVLLVIIILNQLAIKTKISP